MNALSDRELRGDVLREGQSTLAEAIEAARNSERLWDRIRGSMARDPSGNKTVKKIDQAWARDPKEDVEESWKSKADSIR